MIVEDERANRTAIKTVLSETYSVEACDTAEAAEVLIDNFDPDLVLADVRLPGACGLSLVPRIIERERESVAIVMTGHSTVDLAVQAMRAGARNFIVKPIDMEQLERLVESELKRLEIARSLKQAQSNATNPIHESGLWADSHDMRAILRMATDVARSVATVLISGPSGSGKEVLARYLHQQSRRADQPFVAVNCGAIPETLLESEFFGHEAGAFTGAHGMKPGRFERANGGTILLDEIGELPLLMQVKLLRVLQERQIERVGGSEVIDVDIRVIASTNRDLAALTKAGKFREDLYYRLNVIRLDVPALTERRADIVGLWTSFVHRFCEREGYSAPETTVAALEALLAHDWPGNVRELENAAERAVVLGHGGVIRPEHLPPTVRDSNELVSGLKIPGSSLEEIEKVAILKTLGLVNGSTSKAAEILGISARKIQYRMRQWRAAANDTH